jgi:hypoxanthine phosphoribosyltransferase
MDNLKQEIQVHDKKFKLLINPAEIQDAVDRIARKINEEYRNKKPVFIITLKGALIFAVDLLKKIDFECEIETIRAKSYGSGMVSGGNVLISQMTGNISGKDVIIIEDIVDTGLTIFQLRRELELYKPNSIKVATFLMKPSMLQNTVEIDYVGIEIPPDFVVGYGLDYAEYGRNLPAIYALDEK